MASESTALTVEEIQGVYDEAARLHPDDLIGANVFIVDTLTYRLRQNVPIIPSITIDVQPALVRYTRSLLALTTHIRHASGDELHRRLQLHLQILVLAHKSEEEASNVSR